MKKQRSPSSITLILQQIRLPGTNGAIVVLPPVWHDPPSLVAGGPADRPLIPVFDATTLNIEPAPAGQAQSMVGTSVCRRGLRLLQRHPNPNHSMEYGECSIGMNL